MPSARGIILARRIEGVFNCVVCDPEARALGVRGGSDAPGVADDAWKVVEVGNALLVNDPTLSREGARRAALTTWLVAFIDSNC